MRNKLLLLLGTSLILVSYCTMFIYIRPARDIPFQLNLLSFSTLVWIVSLYIFVLYKHTQTPTMKIAMPQIILQFFAIILEALHNVDKKVKYPIQTFYVKFFSRIANKVSLKNIQLWSKIIFTISFIPRILLTIVFLLDVFHFEQLFYFFKILWVSIFMFLPLYLRYCFHDVSQIIITFLEKNLESISTEYVFGILPPEEDYWHDSYLQDEDEPDQEPPHEMYLTVRRFFEFKYVCCYTNRYKDADFYCNFTKEYYTAFEKEHNVPKEKMLNKEQRGLFYSRLTDRVRTILNIYEIFACYDNIQKNILETKKMSTTLAIIISSYLLGWCYILIRSANTLNMLEVLELLKILTNYSMSINPFENP